MTAVRLVEDREMAAAAATLSTETARAEPKMAEPKMAEPKMKVAVTSAKQPDYVEGRRSFFKYRDLGVTKASDGWMRAQLMSAVTGMTEPTGWHYHVCEGQFVYALKGFVELEFEDGTNCRLEAGDSCFIPGGMRHNEIRTSDDIEILEICLPANMGTVPCEPPAKGA
jgi:mannose-6-phosphate isomerase-like protein (cupin superfamily)